MEETAMTKKERVTAAIRGEEVDKIPSGFSLHFPKESVRKVVHHKGPFALVAAHGKPHQCQAENKGCPKQHPG